MMPWLAAPLIMGLGKIGMHLLRKPKKYDPNTEWLDKFMAEKKSDLATKEVRHLIMQGSMKQIGANTASAMENVNYESAQYGLKGTGIDAAKKLNILKAGHKASAKASRVAEIEQRKVDAQTRNTLDSAMMMKERILAEAKQRNEMAEDQWSQGLTSEIIGAGANIAMAGFADDAAWGKAEKLATASGFEGNLRELAKDPQTALKIAGINMEQAQSEGYFGELAKEYGITREYDSQYNLQQNLKLLQTDIQEKGNYQDLTAFGMATNKDLRVEQIDMAVSKGAITVDHGMNLYKRFSPTKEETWWTQTSPTEETEYRWDENNKQVPTGRVKSRYQAPDTGGIGASEKLIREQREAKYQMRSETDYRKRYDIGNVKYLEKVEELMVGGISDEEINKSIGAINDYVMSVGNEDLDKLAGLDLQQFNQFKETVGQGMEELMAYREFLRGILNRKFGPYIKKIPHNPLEEIMNEVENWNQ